MPHQVIWAKCAVVNPKDGTEEIVERGDLLPDYVSEFQLFTLMSIGGVKYVEKDALDPALTPAGNVPLPVLLPEHDPALVASVSGVDPAKLGVPPAQRTTPTAETAARTERAAADKDKADKAAAEKAATEKAAADKAAAEKTDAQTRRRSGG